MHKIVALLNVIFAILNINCVCFTKEPTVFGCIAGWSCSAVAWTLLLLMED